MSYLKKLLCVKKTQNCCTNYYLSDKIFVNKNGKYLVRFCDHQIDLG